MPDPKDFKSQESWMGACMHQTLKHEDKEQDQAVAQCLNMWRKKSKKKVRRGKKSKRTAGEILRCAAEALLVGQPPSADKGTEDVKRGAPHHYIVNKTYEIVTPESAEEGEAEERGFDYEDRRYDTLRDLLEDHDNRESWVEWSSSHVSGSGEWLNSEGEQDYKTGSYTNHGLHIKRSDGKPLSKREVDAISKAFGVRGYTYVGSRME